MLVAEDDDDLREAFCAALRGSGFAPLAAADGQEMLGLFSGASSRELEQPDAIVMDIRMPRHTGVELLIALRLAEWQVPVLFITGFADDRARRIASELGVLEVLEKPVTSLDLVAAVGRAVGKLDQPLGGLSPARSSFR